MNILLDSLRGPNVIEVHLIDLFLSMNKKMPWQIYLIYLMFFMYIVYWLYLDILEYIQINIYVHKKCHMLWSNFIPLKIAIRTRIEYLRSLYIPKCICESSRNTLKYLCYMSFLLNIDISYSEKG